MTPEQRAAIRKEIRALKKLTAEARTNHGAACSLSAAQSLEWVLRPKVAPPPSAFTKFADFAAFEAQKRWTR